MQRVVHIMRKWKNLKDTFKKEVHKYEKSGSAMIKKAKYCYFDNLSFLQPNFDGRSTSGNMAHENDNSVEEINVIDNLDSPTASDQAMSPGVPNTVPKQPKKKLSVFQEHVLNAIEKRNNKEEVFDGNKHFLLSLLPAMKSMDDQNSMKFRIDVMQLLQKYTTNNDNQTSQPYSSHQLYTTPQPLHTTSCLIHHISLNFNHIIYLFSLQPYTYTQQSLENTVRNQEYSMANQNTNDIL
ncbi:uncharacterized protein LOC111026837 [Myzus persicae]|uniref:uncharacterized protein LOC111026837 n=1 Tax=Myzus persicae TaxID=13164 RepID=UPI000B939286|nr:uncharacterized protein LOC111026837 [Myzus persicae]